MQTRYPIRVMEPKWEGREVVVHVAYSEEPTMQRHSFRNWRRARKFFYETEAEIDARHEAANHLPN